MCSNPSGLSRFYRDKSDRIDAVGAAKQSANSFREQAGNLAPKQPKGLGLDLSDPICRYAHSHPNRLEGLGAVVVQPKT